jgi:SWI/SNF-related matrix-associated actin-dependent regulator of chromatin subfamily A containing DEAD/H box 1
VLQEIETFSDYDLHQLCLQYEGSLGKYSLAAETLYDSPKMNYLRDLLPRLQHEGHRMLLFSQWTRLLDLLEILLNDMEMPFLRLDGSTPIAERQDLIDQFSREDAIPVFLLSTKAGGLGINLTAADTVILHDLDFNPENDKQAEDRCHRIGQTKPVTIYRLVCKDTVDEDIYDMGERKRQLSQAVLSDHRSPQKGGGQHARPAKEDDELNLISRILSKALNKKKQ